MLAESAQGQLFKAQQAPTVPQGLKLHVNGMSQGAVGDVTAVVLHVCARKQSITVPRHISQYTS